jgi:hypothetical protein
MPCASCASSPTSVRYGTTNRVVGFAHGSRARNHMRMPVVELEFVARSMPRSVVRRKISTSCSQLWTRSAPVASRSATFESYAPASR